MAIFKAANQFEIRDISEYHYDGVFNVIAEEWRTFYALPEGERDEDAALERTTLLEGDIVLQGIPRALARDLCANAQFETLYNC